MKQLNETYELDLDPWYKQAGCWSVNSLKSGHAYIHQWTWLSAAQIIDGLSPTKFQAIPWTNAD